MILSRLDLKEYLEEDRKALGFNQKHPSIFGQEIWKFQIILRKYEYYLNCTHKFFWGRVMKSFYRYLHHRYSVMLGFTIPPNVFGKGLNIHHYGCIVVNGNAKVGNYCNIQQCVNIGQNYCAENTPIIGDNVYIGPGAKIFGKIQIADGCVIGAGTIVNKSITEKDSIVVGNPARIVGKRKPGLK